MRPSVEVFRRIKPLLGDAVATLLLALAIGATLVTFSIVRLSARLWETKLHGLSQDGSLYVGISHAGIRVHDVETGKEVDRIALRGPLESTCILWSRDSDNYFSGEIENLPPPFHPLEAAAPPDFGFEHPFNYGKVTEPYGRARIVVSLTKRYIGAMFSAGYVMLWDRDTDRFRMIGEPDYFFEQLSIDENRGELLIEGTRRIGDRVLLDKKSPILQEQVPWRFTPPLEVLIYRLSTMEQQEARSIKGAGRRVEGDPNLRFTVDSQRNQYCVWQWEAFPRGMPRLLHRFQRADAGATSHGQIIEALRSSEGICYLAQITEVGIEFLRETNGLTTSRRLKLPKDYEDAHPRWVADGHALLLDDACNGISTWDADRSWSVYQLPLESYHEAVVIRGQDESKRLRAASLEGDVVDLPIGVKGEPIRRKLDLRVYPNHVFFANAVLALIGASWCCWAARQGALFTQGGWMVLLLLLGYFATICSIECFANRIDFGFAIHLAAWLFLDGISFVAGVRLLTDQFSFRSSAVVVLAILGMLILMEIPGRANFVVNRPLAGQSCTLFVDDEEAQFWLN